MRYEIFYSCISHIGHVRNINQDNFICNGLYIQNDNPESEFRFNGQVDANQSVLFGIFDGMGGEECGEMASRIAAKEAQKTSLSKKGVLVLTEYCKQANKKICEYAENNNISSMGTTVAMLLFTKREITLCNIGDSKIFRFSNGKLEQISKDHVVISAFGTKPPLLQNLGIPPEQLLIEPYLSQGGYKDGDKYLICSDGLTDMVTVNEIKELLNEDSVKNITSKLVSRALENGGKDNTTVILLEIKQRKNKFIKVFTKQNGGR